MTQERNIFTPPTNNMKTQEKYPSKLWFPWEETESTSQHKGRWGEGNNHHSSICQKSASRVKTLSIVSAITAKRWYSATRFSKKFVFPSREIFSMKSKGFSAWKTCGRKTHWWFWQGNNALKTRQQTKLSNSFKRITSGCNILQDLWTPT